MSRLIAVALLMLGTAPLGAQTAATRGEPPSEKIMTTMARGTFTVRMKPLPSDEIADAALIGRMSIDKDFHGDIEGSSKGQMLATGTPAEGSAGYVALERVTGTLAGKHGAFSLQHSAWMAGGKQGMTITVVPGSGTEELVGLSGSLLIIIADGQHSYEFSYTLPAR